MGRVDQWPHLGFAVQAVAEPQPLCPFGQERGETVVYHFMYDQAAGGGAALAAGAEATPERPFQGQFQVGVVHDDDGVLPTHLQGQGAVQRGQQPLQMLPGRAGAGKGGGVDSRMGEQILAYLLTRSADEIDHSGRDARLFQDGHQGRRAGRRLGGGFEYHAVAADQGGEKLPGRDGDRKIPGGDQRHDTQRFAHAFAILVRQFRGHGFSLQAASFSSHVEGDVYRLLHIAQPLGEDLAHLPCDQFAEPLLVFDKQPAGPEQNLAPPGSGQQAPLRKGRPGRRHGPVHIRPARQRRLGNKVAVVGRVAAGKTYAIDGIGPVTGDEVFDRLGHGTPPRLLH